MFRVSATLDAIENLGDFGYHYVLYSVMQFHFLAASLKLSRLNQFQHPAGFKTLAYEDGGLAGL
jgi:hypothetical protein